MTDIAFLVLIIIHVSAVVSWMGASILFVSVLLPSVKEMGPDQRLDFLSKAIPRFSKFMAATSITAILAGFFLFDYVSTVAIDLAPSGWRILVLYPGAILGFVAAVITLTLLLPMSNRLRNLKTTHSGGAGGERTSNEPRVDRMFNSLTSGLRAISFLLAVILVLMILSASL